MNSAADYVTLAERRSGPIPRGVAFDYVWGDLLDDLEQRRCDIRLINLETAITTSDSRAAKGINYRMNPRNIGVLTVAGIDACTLAINHVMALIDSDLVDVVFGHSSHHPMGIELYRGKLILYGCGDLINDYEGIGGNQSYRSELALAPIVDLDLASGRLESLELLAYERRSFSLHRADKEACAWLEELMRRESTLGGARMTLSAAGSIIID